MERNRNEAKMQGWAWNCWKEKDEERRDAKKEVEQKERKEDGKEGKSLLLSFTELNTKRVKG